MNDCVHCGTPYEGEKRTDCCDGSEAQELRECLATAMELLGNARCDLGDPWLRRSWAQRRGALRRRVA